MTLNGTHRMTSRRASPEAPGPGLLANEHPSAGDLRLSAILLRNAGDSDSGMAVLDADNIFLYHNHAFACMFGFPDNTMVGKHYDDMMVRAYTHRCGQLIEASSIEEWLCHVHTKQRSARFRSFEVDLIDGRWLLITEQVNVGGEMVVMCNDITRQKNTEFALKHAHAELQRLALTDELTGIPNRRHFFPCLDTELERASRYGRSTCLAILDLDHFKRVNDRHGHAAGDAVLRHFADILGRHLRAADVVGRLGGEEFAVLLPETGMDEALFVLRRIVEQLALETVDAVVPGFTYTFSGGVAAVDGAQSVTSQWLLAAADRALYQAKSGGRNRINAWLPDAAGTPGCPAD
jgi:diguanylate cyclase (GGDEF)-like protein/PAS domain S-box-containing protein